MYLLWPGDGEAYIFNVHGFEPHHYIEGMAARIGGNACKPRLRLAAVGAGLAPREPSCLLLVSEAR